MYGSSAPSGENVVFELERSLLERRGHAVRCFVRHSDEIRARGALGLVQGALATPWNPWTVHAIRRAIAAFSPEVVHVHNTFPLISPSVFHAVGSRAARVLTLHNYRLLCPAGIPLRDGKPCVDCLDQRSVRSALRHGCYRGSRIATLPLAASVTLHRWLRTWEKHVDAFVALTDFQRAVMVAAGLPASRVWVKPNFYPGTPAVVPWTERGEHAVFVGRLSEEKGVVELLDAWCAWGPAAPELRILGEGPLRASLEEKARAHRAGRVTFLGQLPSARAETEIAHARLMVVPSICFEGFPMVMREAFAFGTPVAVSDAGPLPGIVERGRAGLVFRAGVASSLLEVVRGAWQTPAKLEALSLQARRAYELRYAEASNYEQLMAIYESARGVQAVFRSRV